MSDFCEISAFPKVHRRGRVVTVTTMNIYIEGGCSPHVLKCRIFKAPRMKKTESSYICV